MNTHAAIAGSSIRFDVPTKCQIVESILTQKFSDTKALNEFIQLQADKLAVNPVTIKVWCAQFANNYLIGKQLPAGVMSFVTDPLNNKSIPVVRPQLESIRNTLRALKAKYHVPRDRTPSEVLEELINK